MSRNGADGAAGDSDGADTGAEGGHVSRTARNAHFPYVLGAAADFSVYHNVCSQFSNICQV